jgi:hypothetical protein
MAFLHYNLYTYRCWSCKILVKNWAGFELFCAVCRWFYVISHYQAAGCFHYLATRPWYGAMWWTLNFWNSQIETLNTFNTFLKVQLGLFDSKSNLDSKTSNEVRGLHKQDFTNWTVRKVFKVSIWEVSKVQYLFFFFLTGMFSLSCNKTLIWRNVVTQQWHELNNWSHQVYQ